jgi:nitrate reductase alpha subunit
LPTAGYYESSSTKYSDTASPYHVMREQAVEPVGDSKQEWWIFSELCKRIQAMAPGMGITEYEDEDLGLTRSLADIYDVYTENGKYAEDTDTMEFVKLEMATSKIYEDTDFETFRKEGQVNWTNEGTRYGATSRPNFKVTPGKPHAAASDHVERKQPWYTLTGRTQFYLDHDWFLEFGEELPTWVAPPKMGGDHPFRFTCGHARWSIHSFMRDNALMLQLQRGEPIVYINDEDAKERGITDHELVEIFNDVGSFEVHVKTTPLMQRYQMHSYHAWETFQFKDGHSHAAIMASQIKPLGMVGNYGHMKYSVGFYQPTNVDKGTTCDVRKAVS